MKLAVIGTGYVGLVAGACFADIGNEVICVDIEKEKIDLLNRGEVPIYEPGLAEMLSYNIREGRLFFSTDIRSAVEKSQIIFIAVGTPTLANGSVDMNEVFAAAQSIGNYMNEYKIVVIKSTVPIGTNEMIAKLLREKNNYDFTVVSNPEFLKEGAAIDDFLRPDRIIIGTENEEAAETMRKLYRPFIPPGKSILTMDSKSAELSKYVSNALLATKISFMNDIANLCDLLGADVEMVRQGVGTDSRIGPRFIFPGTGYGGSCFPKDVKAIIKTAKEIGYRLSVVEAVDKVNDKQKTILMKKIESHFENNLSGKTFAVWGLSFKPKTDDMRGAPSVDMIKLLISRGTRIKAHDPEAMNQATFSFEGLVDKSLTLFNNMYDALQGADALIIMTEWNVFREPDFDRMRIALNEPVIFDGRNIYDPKTLKEFGFEYYSIGRPPIRASN